MEVIKKPVVIGKNLNPRCFKNFNVSSFVHYKANSKAWVTTNEFQSYVRDLDKEMRNKRRKIALTVDNAPSHKCDNLTNIELIFYHLI